MALFGAPIAHEDDPQRAIKAAMEMQKIMEADAAESSLRRKVVINSGLVIAGQVGSDLRMEYSVIGDTVNVAARIEKLANAGDILVGENTYKLAKQGFTYEALPPAMVKGKKEPVQVYKVTGSRKLVETISGAGNIVYTPLIGREKEINMLKSVFEKARAGEGQTVSLIGNAGLGKSRLMYELRTQIPAKKISYLRIECFSYTKAIPYYPFVEIIKNHFDFKDSDTRIQLDKKLKDTVAKKNMDWAVPYLKKLLSMELTEQEVLPTDPKEVKSNIFKALAGIIKSADKNKTAILVIKDIHWLDGASLEFLDYQVKNMHDKALFLVVSRQPDICLTWEEESNHTGIEVKKLSNKEISSFLTDSLNIKNISKEFFALIKKKSDGNPLYIEELSRSLIDKNVLVKDNGNYVVQGDIANLGIPDSIQGVLMSRIDLLDNITKKTLQFASCIGPAFEHRLLEKIAPEGANIDKCLLELKIRNFIIPVEG
ncbi:MAG: AAA family ATPase, partial [Candidatus Omnitrophica bacterium]|nr:AAA family ATPase [Candidatus Omnitrophota bacterium]